MNYCRMVLLAAMLLLSSCAKVSSKEVKSGGIFATFAVKGDSVGKAVCEATFQVGGETGTFLSLDDGDVVTCAGKGMKKTELLGSVTYSTDVTYEVGRTYKFSFTRPDETPYEAVVSMPEPVTITYPRGSERLAVGSGVDVRWQLGTSTDFDMSMVMTGPNSVASFAPEFPDKGSRFISADFFTMPAGSSSENFTATVQRRLAGTFPDGLNGGKSWGKQERSVTFSVGH